jgi:tight adherence protein B
MPDDVAIGVVGFDSETEVLAPISSDRTTTLEAIENLTLELETHLYDGVITAADLFSSDAQRNILLLSDGADSGSTATLQEAIDAATEAEANIFSIGLESGAFDEAALTALANETEGVYTPASTGALEELFNDIGEGLSNQYVMTYESTVGFDTQVGLQLSAAGASDSSLFITGESPDIPGPDNPDPESPPLLRGTVGLIIVLGLFFLAAFAIAIAIVGANLRAKRDRELARRMAASTDPIAAQDDAERAPFAGWIPQPLVDIAGSFTESASFRVNLDKQLEQAGVAVKAEEFVAGSVLGAAIAFILSGLLLGNPFLMLIFTVLGAFAPKFLLSLAVNRRRAKIQGQLPDILMILASSLRAGHSFFQALDMVSKEIGEPGAIEFSRVVAEIRLGRAVDEALIAMGERIGSEDFKWAVLAVNIQRDVGGNLAEVLDTVADTLREREVIRRQVKVLSAEGRLSMYILTGLPILIALYISRVNPGYLNLLFSTAPGRVMLLTGIALLGVGIFWMQKIVKIDV